MSDSGCCSFQLCINLLGFNVRAGGVITCSLPFIERTGMRGSSIGSSSSSCMMCVFLDLEEVLTRGSSSSFSGSFYVSIGELSIVDLTSSSSCWSEWSSSSDSASTCGFTVAFSSGSFVSVAFSLTAAGGSVVLVAKLYYWSNESGKSQWLRFIYTTNWCRWLSKCCK